MISRLGQVFLYKIFIFVYTVCVQNGQTQTETRRSKWSHTELVGQKKHSKKLSDRLSSRFSLAFVPCGLTIGDISVYHNVKWEKSLVCGYHHTKLKNIFMLLYVYYWSSETQLVKYSFRHLSEYTCNLPKPKRDTQFRQSHNFTASQIQVSIERFLKFVLFIFLLVD